MGTSEERHASEPQGLIIAAILAKLAKPRRSHFSHRKHISGIRPRRVSPATIPPPLSAAAPADTQRRRTCPKMAWFAPPHWPVFLSAVDTSAGLPPDHAGEKESDRAFDQASLNLGSSVPESSSPGMRKW
jgi:hypothetical protein